MPIGPANSIKKITTVAVVLLKATATFGSQDASKVIETLKTQDDLAQEAHIEILYTVKTPTSDFSCDTDINYKGSDYVAKEKHGNSSNILWTDGKWLLSETSKAISILKPSISTGAYSRDPSAAPNAIGALFCEGRGLSSLNDIKLDSAGSFVTLRAKGKGREYRATLDPNQGYVATKIELFAPSGSVPLFTYSNSGFQRDAKGFIFASHCVSGTKAIQQQFTVQKLETNGSNLDHPEWMRKGITIADNRVQPGLAYTYDDILQLNGGKQPTLDELYELSLKRRGEFDIRKAQDKLVVQHVESDRQNGRIQRFAIAIFGIFVSLGLLLFAKRLLKSR